MDDAAFARLIDDFLLPMFPGASRTAATSLAPRQRKTVSYSAPGGGNQLLIRPDENAAFEFMMARSQKFDPSDVTLVEAFVKSAAEVRDALAKPFEAEVLRGLPLRVVARAAGGDQHETLLRVLEQFTAWAAEQYEGRPIVGAAGIDPSASGHFDVGELWRESYAPVLTNGMDTLLVLDASGRVAALTTVTASAPAPYGPVRYAHIAGWSSSARVAVALNRSGEILVFANGEMRFALRRGRWLHFTHGPIVSSIHLPHRREAKSAVYETLLDVAFARSGGCIAVVDKANISSVADVVAAKDLVIPAPPALPSLKGQLLSSAVGTSFADLDRRVRAELVAMDGAMVLSHQGTILAVGAIVKIDAGSSGGGRLAAARSLAKLGFAAKVSQDGGVQGFDAVARAAAASEEDWGPSFRFG